MKLKKHLNTKGVISIEALITLPVLIMVFSIFIFYISYLNVMVQLTEDLSEKTYELSINDYKYNSSLPTIIKLYDKDEKKKMNIEYLFCYTNTIGGNITIYLDCVFNGYFKKVKIHLEQQIKKWKGDGINYGDINVWKLSNYRRGLAIEEIFGGNLPKYFPVIDGYNQLTGEIFLITSIDSSALSYQDLDCFYKRIEKEVKELSDFNGVVFEEYNITSEDISNKKLIVVFPNNSFSQTQLEVLDDINNLCIINNIQFIVKRYQNSNIYHSK